MKQFTELLTIFGVSFEAHGDNLTVGGNLYLYGLNITSLPDNLTVGGDLDLEDTDITTLPDNLTVGGDLDLRRTDITSLPDNLTVGGYLDLRDTKITHCEVKKPTFFDLWKPPVTDGFITLYKRVSKDWKTQEGTKNETTWEIGTTVTVKHWEPEKDECGAGKFHGCAKSVFCDKFRSSYRDRYIAIKVAVEDMYDWPCKKEHLTKIAFRSGEVLYECDARGNRIEGG